MDYLGRGGATAFPGDKQRSARSLRKLLVCVDDFGDSSGPSTLAQGFPALDDKKITRKGKIHIARERMIVHLSSYLSSAWSIYLASRSVTMATKAPVPKTKSGGLTIASIALPSTGRSDQLGNEVHNRVLQT